MSHSRFFSIFQKDEDNLKNERVLKDYDSLKKEDNLEMKTTSKVAACQEGLVGDLPS